jgi:hypothetical protein
MWNRADSFSAWVPLPAPGAPISSRRIGHLVFLLRPGSPAHGVRCRRPR